jgi:hypothetical protein
LSAEERERLTHAAASLAPNSGRIDHEREVEAWCRAPTPWLTP